MVTLKTRYLNKNAPERQQRMQMVGVLCVTMLAEKSAIKKRVKRRMVLFTTVTEIPSSAMFIHTSCVGVCVFKMTCGSIIQKMDGY